MKPFCPDCIKLLFLNVAILLATQELTVIAQEGSPFQTDFTSTDESLNENYSICTDREGVLIIANRKGILTFDVEEWKLVKTPELPLVVMSEPISNRVFIGCRNNIGILQKNELGEYEYISLVGKEAGAVTQIAFIKNYAYFMSQSVISRVNMSNMNDVRYWKSKASNKFVSLMVLKNKLLVDTDDGLQTPEDKGMQPFLTNFPLNGSIIFSLPFDENTIMIGASDNKCYLFDGKTVKNFQLQDQQYLSDGIINDGRILDHGKIVISTSGAGCLVFEMKTGKTVFTTNYQTGLPDDEIYALGTDRNNGIWLAHNYGLTRIDAEIPVKNFTTFKGLNGNIQTLEFLNRKLFIGTSNGVYFLDKKKDYVEYTIKQAQVANIAAPASAKTAVGSVQIKETKKGFFGRLFSKKQKSTEDPAANNSETQEETSSLNLPGESSREKAIQKKVYRITSVSHVFTKVQGIEHKCKQLFMFNGQLIAVTISGVYEISEKRAALILPNIEANYSYASPSENSIYLCTNKGIVIVKKIANSWQTINFPVSAGEPVYSFAKDMFDNYWIGSENKVYKAKLNKDGSIKGLKIFKFSSEYRERMIVRISNKKPVFFLSSGIYSIINDSIQPNLTMSKFVGTDTKYYFTQQDYTWIRKGNKWISLSVNAEPDSIASNYLNLFDNINQIHADNNSNLWIINNNLNLYKIDQKGITSYNSDFSAFIKRFSGISGEKFSLYELN